MNLTWRILVVGNSTDIHASTGKLSEIGDILGRGVSVDRVDSMSQADPILLSDRKFAVVVLDASGVQLTPGLALAQRIRGEFAMPLTRIVMQAGAQDGALEANDLLNSGSCDYLIGPDVGISALHDAVLCAIRAYGQLEQLTMDLESAQNAVEAAKLSIRAIAHKFRTPLASIRMNTEFVHMVLETGRNVDKKLLLQGLEQTMTSVDALNDFLDNQSTNSTHF